MFCTLAPSLFGCQHPNHDTNTWTKCTKNSYAFAAFVVDVLTPIAILVIGILGVFSVLRLPLPLTWSFIGGGSAYTIFTFYMLFLLKKDTPAEGPSQTPMTTPPVEPSSQEI